MPPTCPAPNCDRSGFTLIETLVAITVATLAVAAAATSVLTATRLHDAAVFYRAAAETADLLQATRYGWPPADTNAASATLQIDQELLTGGPPDQLPAWEIYTLRDHRGRRHEFALHPSPAPGSP